MKNADWISGCDGNHEVSNNKKIYRKDLEHSKYRYIVEKSPKTHQTDRSDPVRKTRKRFSRQTEIRQASSSS